MTNHSPSFRASWLAGLAFLLAAPGLFAAPAITHLVHISVDGLGAVYLQPYMMAAPEQFPNFVRLKTQGAFTFNARCDYGASETIPNHTSMFTGRPAMYSATVASQIKTSCCSASTHWPRSKFRRSPSTSKEVSRRILTAPCRWRQDWRRCLWRCQRPRVCGNGRAWRRLRRSCRFF